MEDFVYIILAVVWLLISILGNKKKKAQQQQKQPNQERRSVEEARPQPVSGPEPSGPSDFEVLLDDFFGEDTKSKKPVQEDVPEEEEKYVFSEEYTFQGSRAEENTVKEEISSEEPVKYEGKFTFDEDYKFFTERSLETIDDYIKSYDDQDRIAEEKDSQLVLVELDDEYGEKSTFEFDGKKAIIYSEIMNRRYT